MIFVIVIWRSKILFFLVIILTSNNANCFASNFGAKVGVSFSIGTHVNRIGIMGGMWFVANHVQLNGILHGNFSSKSFGPKQSRFELQMSEGIQYFFGNKNVLTNRICFMNPSSNFSNYGYGFSYTFKHYFDHIGLRQGTAIMHINIHNLILAHENDALLFSYLDKFRTGAFSIRYEFDSKQMQNYFYSNAISAKVQLFTGNSLSKKSVRRTDTKYPAQSGYLDLSEAECGSCSNGILMLEYETALPFNQNSRIQVGMDDERIRNRIQNKWIHDMKFVPQFFGRKANAHIPMITIDGKPYLFESNQLLRKSKPYFQFGMNEPMFW